MKTEFTRSLSSAGFVLAILGCAVPANANGDAGNSYVGITSGGPIAAEDRIASDDLSDTKTSAQISSDNDLISANFSLDMTSTGFRKISTDGRFITFNTSNFSVKASIPLNKSEDHSAVDFKTFGNDGKLTFGFNTYRAKFVSPFATLPDLAQFAEGCIAFAGKDWVGGPLRGSPEKVDMVLKEYEGSATKFGSIGARLEAASTATKTDENGGFGAYALEFCKVGGSGKIGNDNDYIRFAKESADNPNFSPSAWRRRYFDPQNTVFWGGEASLGYNRFSIVNRTTVSSSRIDRLGFDVSGRVGLIVGNSGTVILLSGGFVRSYKAKDVVDVCGPPDLSGKTVCVNGQDGTPDRTQTGYGTLSVRKVLLRNRFGEPILGVRPSVTYIKEDKDWQFELPVYLQRSDKGGLDAGVRLIYNTGNDKFGLGAFVGTSF